MSDDTGFHYRFLHDPVFVNTHHCDHTGDNELSPYFSYWNFELQVAPKNTWFDIWISVYWDCYDNEGISSVYCTSEDIHHRDYVK